MHNDAENKDEWDIPVHVTESDEDLEELAALFEDDPIDDPYAIVCPVCGHDEFEDIVVRARKRIRWSKKSIWELGRFTRYIQSMRCLRCDYILNFARE